ncbi:MAG TPA: family 10 glycosylhydrolase [Lacipirellulaceae bacterium]|jgi:uncharacterized lipoprotein YddW (UPF0748 family)|nr:family 10 glycosylhydrolase [Lacipirellulaceae bacterium]
MRMGCCGRNIAMMALLSLVVQVCPVMGGRAFAETPNAADEPAAVAREFRGVWVATVKNIDWPSRPGLSGDEQQRELIKILDKCVELNLNAVVLQIRTEADALYPSKLEPWSEFLSGRMGQPPKPYYDPLEFAIAEAHRRGLQLHVWFNPYRVRVPEPKDTADKDSKDKKIASKESGSASNEKSHISKKNGPASKDHASLANANIVRKYGGYLWFDPGEPEAEERFIAVLNDVVKRYDIDGVHIDDYFYPYEEKGKDGKIIPFPDDASYARAKAKGEKLELHDWRRQNVNHLIHRMYDEVKKAKPWVLVGISPFGIWRPDNPPGTEGYDQYDKLYADVKKWQHEGWLDYLTPQLYWTIDSEHHGYSTLLAWWAEQNVQKRHLWPGNFTSKLVHPVVDQDEKDEEKKEKLKMWKADELIRQIEATRAIPGATGNVHFSMKAFMRDFGGIDEKLKSGLYAEPALVPESPWLDGETPGKPEVNVASSAGASEVKMRLPGGEHPWQWLVRMKTSDGWRTAIVPGNQTAYELKGTKPTSILVSAISRLGREGASTRSEIPKRD